MRASLVKDVRLTCSNAKEYQLIKRIESNNYCDVSWEAKINATRLEKRWIEIWRWKEEYQRVTKWIITWYKACWKNKFEIGTSYSQ